MITKAVLPGFRPSLHSEKADSCVFPRPWVHGVKFLLVGLTCVRARWPSKAREEDSQRILDGYLREHSHRLSL